MPKIKFSENQIIIFLKEVEKGRAVKDVCREHSVSEATYYQWKSNTAVQKSSDASKVARDRGDIPVRLIGCGAQSIATSQRRDPIRRSLPRF
jgi:transposase-like protein